MKIHEYVRGCLLILCNWNTSAGTKISVCSTALRYCFLKSTCKIFKNDFLTRIKILLNKVELYENGSYLENACMFIIYACFITYIMSFIL